jgi:hypothetical protein
MSIRNGPERAIFTVARYNGGWAIEHAGEYFDHSADKEEVKAAANKRARAATDAGQACLVRVSGEQGFFQAA